MHRYLGFAFLLAAYSFSGCRDSAPPAGSGSPAALGSEGTGGSASAKVLRTASGAAVAPACGLGELTEAEILAVTRNPADAPLADLSPYAARHAPRASDAKL
ncbi:MAG TPA: hypothetical protein VNO21_11865, partial [Polyangiaceae bacterium]|nr:hypothetical protein [Polyangiaceae bacterium]